MVTVAMDKDVVVPWSVVVKGEPSDAVKKVIEAAAVVIK